MAFLHLGILGLKAELGAGDFSGEKYKFVLVTQVSLEGTRVLSGGNTNNTVEWELLYLPAQAT